MRPIALPCFSVALVLSFAAQARSASARSTAQRSAAQRSTPTALPKDLALTCIYRPSDLVSWSPAGVHLAGETRTRFKKLATFGSARAHSSCHTLPPKVAVTPGPDKGGVVAGDIVVAQQDVTVYRAYASGKFACSLLDPAAEFGGWWSLEPLGGDKAAYRKKVAVCPSWNDFGKQVKCTLKKGSAVIIGATQSARCVPGPNACTAAPASFTVGYQAQSSHQVFINTRSPDRTRFLVDCVSKNW